MRTKTIVYNSAAAMQVCGCKYQARLWVRALSSGTHRILSCQLVGEQSPQGIIQLHCWWLLVNVDSRPVGARHTRTTDMHKPE
jgi:hypothetical protein